MDVVTLARQALLFAHVIAFAIAMAEVLRGDLKLLRERQIDLVSLARTARLVSYALLALWITGGALVWIETGFDPATILSKPKLVTKLIVVAALSANGGLLHSAAFPMLEHGRAAPMRTTVLCSLLGAVSTVSWFYAAFLGVGRIIAPAMTLSTFLELYAVLLVGGLTVAGLVVAPIVARRIVPAESAPMPAAEPLVLMPDEAKWRQDADVADVVPALRRSA